MFPSSPLLDKRPAARHSLADALCSQLATHATLCTARARIEDQRGGSLNSLARSQSGRLRGLFRFMRFGDWCTIPQGDTSYRRGGRGAIKPG